MLHPGSPKSITCRHSGRARLAEPQGCMGPRSDCTPRVPRLKLQACATATLTRHTTFPQPKGPPTGGWYSKAIGRSRQFSAGTQWLYKPESQLWLLVFVPVVFLAAKLKPEGQTLLFVLSVLAIVPLTVLLSHATESVAAKIGDALGGLLNATLGNLAELIIALTALRAGQYMLVKASIAGPIVANTLFIMGGAFFLGGLKHHVQEYNKVSAHLHAALLLLATVALLIPSAIAQADSTTS